MNLIFRPTSLADIELYMECFSNEEFQTMMYYNNPLKFCHLNEYISQNQKDFKFIVEIYNKKSKPIKIGFAHLYYKDETIYTYVGGLHPKLFDSGYGVYASASFLAHTITTHPDWRIQTVIYKHNVRSLKIHIKLGFRIKEEDGNRYKMELTKDSYNTEFSNYITRRVSHIVIQNT